MHLDARRPLGNTRAGFEGDSGAFIRKKWKITIWLNFQHFGKGAVWKEARKSDRLRSSLFLVQRCTLMLEDPWGTRGLDLRGFRGILSKKKENHYLAQFSTFWKGRGMERDPKIRPSRIFFIFGTTVHLDARRSLGTARAGFEGVSGHFFEKNGKSLFGSIFNILDRGRYGNRPENRTVSDLLYFWYNGAP